MTKNEQDTLPIVLAANLIALAAIGLGLLNDRTERDALQSRLIDLSTKTASMEQRLVPWSTHASDFRERLARAHTFSLFVRTPDRVVQRYEMPIKNMLVNPQARIRILAVAPNTEAMNVLCRFDARYSDMMRLFLDHSLPALKKSTGAGNRIELHGIDVVPSCLINLIDEDKADAVAYITILSWQQSGDLRPSVRLTRRDGAAFEFFRMEFQELWKNSHDLLAPAPPSNGQSTAAATHA